MLAQGKGYFIWKISDCERGDVDAIANLAQQASFTHLVIKIADGKYSYNVASTGVDLVPPLVRALHARGIQALGWHYVYGDDPVSEANIAIQRVRQTGVDGYVIDAEREYKVPGKDRAAASFMSRMRLSLPAFPIALCSYRFPSYHPQLPWREFLEKCAYNMPQVYWQSNHNPADQLTRSVNEFQNVTPLRPIIPVGSAYKAGTWAATPADVVSFMQTAQSLNIAAVNFWEWAHTRAYLPEVWTAIREFPWASAPPSQDIAQQLISVLNSHNPDQVASLYTPAAVHVSAARTVQGAAAIRAWYQALFNQVLPNANFNLASYTGVGSSRQLNWTASSPGGRVDNGSDTLAVTDGKIAYHFTSFTVS